MGRVKAYYFTIWEIKDAMPLSLEEVTCYMSDELLQLEPEDIRASDTVTVVWKLRNN